MSFFKKKLSLRRTKSLSPAPTKDSNNNNGTSPSASNKGKSSKVTSPLSANAQPPFSEMRGLSLGSLSIRNPYTPQQERANHISEHVPPAFRSCLQYLSDPEKIQEEGLFRITGSKTEVSRLSMLFDEHGYIDLRSAADPATVVGLLKERMRTQELPLKANEARLIEMTICIGRQCGMDDTAIISSTQDVFEKFSTSTTDTLKAIVKLLGKVHREASNMMTFNSLGTSVGIQIFPGVTATHSSEILEFLDTHSEQCWKETDMLKPSRRGRIMSSPT
eukprot:m.57596 g.57596  ORF g.57596 m.57596 type:complete len:276 (-) comp22412_c0_seq3:102-929(-)